MAPRSAQPLEPDQLAALTTARLLAYRDRLLAVEQSAELSDWEQHELAAHDSRPLKPGADHLRGKGHILLITDLGPLDVLCEVSNHGYEELVPSAVTFKLGEGLEAQPQGMWKSNTVAR